MSSLATEVVALGKQSAFDTPATTADAVVVVEGKSDFANEPGEGTMRKAQGSVYPVGEEHAVQHGKATYPTALVTRLNGVGNALTSQLTESVAAGVQPESASTCKVHRFTFPTSPKGTYFTLERYDSRRTQALINAVLSKFTLDMGDPQGNATKHMFTPEWLGSIVENADAATTTATAWATFISGLSRHGTADQSKILHTTGNFLIMGSTSAEIRSYMEKMTFDMDFNIDANAAKKAGRKTARNMQMGMDVSAVLTIDSEALTNELMEWAMIGGDDETATAVPYRNVWVEETAVKFGCWSDQSIEKVIQTAPDEVAVTDTPSTTPTASGTYTGDTTKVFHVEIQTVGDAETPGTFKWWTVTDEADGGATSDETEDVDMATEASELEDGVMIAWTTTYGGVTIGDEWSFTAANYRYGFKVTFPKAQISGVTEDVSGDRAKNKAVIKYVGDVGSNDLGYIDVYTNEATAYDA